MNINNHLKRKSGPLFEGTKFEYYELDQKSQKTQQTQLSSQIDKQQLQTMLTVKSKQFVFSCGAVMANIKYDTGNMIGLKYHADKTSNVDEFIKSVGKFIATTGETISTSDKQRLTKEYSKR